jgi:hypothetical protein
MQLEPDKLVYEDLLKALLRCVFGLKLLGTCGPETLLMLNACLHGVCGFAARAAGSWAPFWIA